MATYTTKMSEDNFNTTQKFQSYVSKPEITALAPNFLVKGSKNVLIDYANRVISRNGYKLYNQKNTGGGPVRGSFEWTNTIGNTFSLRSYDRNLEFDWNGVYNNLMNTLTSPYLEFTEVNDFNEQQKVLLWVQGTAAYYRWSGGVTKIRSATATTLQKQGVITSALTIAFNAGTPGTIAPTITDSAGNFLNAGFAAGDIITVIGSTNNSYDFTIASVTAGTITLIMNNVITTEPTGQTITVHNGYPTWKSAQFFSQISGRAILYKGTIYTYTGGEGTDTLTGLTAFPTITLGDSVWQAPNKVALPSDITSPFPSFTANLIACQVNQVILGSTKSPMIFGSSSVDYTNYTLTSPRAPGDPFQNPLTAGSATSIIPVDTLANVSNIQSNFIFGSGRDVFDHMDFHMDNANAFELVRIIQYKAAKGSGLISKNAFCPVKNATVYISREPALEVLGSIESPDGNKNSPLSDLVKNDFDTYDFSHAHVMYWKRAVYISLPNMGLVLIYDLQHSLWQPPQTMPISRFAIINDQLYGHSSITNETYQLFVGTNDNGIFINQVVIFAYNNGGDRSRIKDLTSYWSDGYITTNGVLNMSMNFGFNGVSGKKMMAISGGDKSVTNPSQGNSLGDEQLGVDPLGGSYFDPTVGLPGAGTPLVRFWQDNSIKKVDYIEHYVSYQMTTLNGQFALVAHGSNQFDAGTIPVSHKK